MMNHREYQKKFEQQTNIKNSEFNRLNVNQKKYALLSKDYHQRISKHSPLYLIVYVAMSVSLFFIQAGLGKIILSNKSYSSDAFLVLVLCMSVLFPKVILKLIALKKRNR